MKKIATLAIVLASMFTSTAQAGWVDSLTTSNWPTQKPTTKYKLDSHGWDVRIYEWTPKDNPNVRCVFVAGNQNSSGVACYDVGSKNGK